MTATARADSEVMGSAVENAHLPELVRSYLARSLPLDGGVLASVRVQQTGEMWKKPGARPLRFEAVEDFVVDRVGLSWRARFPIVGPLALTVVDEFAEGDGQLRVSLLGIPLQTQKGPEVPEDPEAPRPAASDCTFGNNATLPAVAVGDRRLLDHEAALRHAHLKRRVVEVARRPPLEPGCHGLKDPSVQSHRVAARAQREPVEVNGGSRLASHAATTSKRHIAAGWAHQR